MPKKSIKAEISTFIKGLITEASPLNFPADASLDEENFELNRDGSRQRRRGFSFEPGFSLSRTVDYTAEDLIQASPITFKWLAASGNPDYNILAVQIKNVIYFFDINQETLTTDGYISSLTLTDFPINIQYSLTSVDGFLVIAAGVDTIAIVSYDGTSFTVSYERLEVRDVWGVEVSDDSVEYDTSFRPSSGTALSPIAIDPFHKYNLQNQSWGISRIDEDDNVIDPVTLYSYFGSPRYYPSNSELVWTGLQFTPASGSTDPREKMFPRLYSNSFGATTLAPKGYFIIDALRRGQSRQSKVSINNSKFPDLDTYTFTPPADLTAGGAKFVQSFAGRIFYAGFKGEVTDGDARSPNMSNFVLFSQLVRNKQDFIKCYQEGDPTSRESSDIVDTDGGFIKLSGVESVIGMVNFGSHLIIIATNGVWAVSGGSDYGFGATNYKSEKISSFGGISNSSIVEDGGRVFFWAEDGIYVIARDQIDGLVVKNITQSTIQSLYQDIPNLSKQNAIGVYDSLNKTIRWIYKTGNTRFSAESQTYELIFNTTLEAFSRNRIYNPTGNNGEIVSAFSSIKFSSLEQVEDVSVGSDLVVVGANQVVVPDLFVSSSLQSTRYLALVIVSGITSLVFGYYRDSQFRDWPQTGSIDAKAYLFTGSVTGGDSSVCKQVPYLIFHMIRTEDGVDVDGTPSNKSSCLVRSQWDFANTINSNRWSALFQVYRYRKPLLITGPEDTYDSGFELITTKNKLRGRGKTFSLYLETEPLKDCRIVGWNLTVNANQYT